jgi:hypothetical protein
MLAVNARTVNVFTVEGGKLVPLTGPFADGGSIQEAVAFQGAHEMFYGQRANDAAYGYARQEKVRDADSLSGLARNPFPSLGAERSYRASDSGSVQHVPSRSKLLMHYAIDAVEQKVRREYGGDAGRADDAWSANLNGAPFLDLISRVREVSEMPRPESNWLLAFPDMIQFQVGASMVPADVRLWSGKPMIGHAGSSSDIPEMTFGSATTNYATAWIILSVSSGYQDMARASAAGAPGTIMTLPEKAEKAFEEVDLCTNDVWWTGAAGAGIYGLLGNSFVARYRDLDLDLATSSAADILAAFSYVGDYVRTASGGSASVDTCLMAPQVEQALSRPISTSDSTLIITRVIEILAGFGIKIERNPKGWRHLNSLSANVHGVVFYNRSNPKKCPRALVGQEPTLYMDTSNPIHGRAYVIAQIGDVHHTGESVLIAEFYKS